MGIYQLPSTHQALLGCHKPQMGFITQAFGLAGRQRAFIDLAWGEIGCGRQDRGIDNVLGTQSRQSLRSVAGHQILAAPPSQIGRVLRVLGLKWALLTSTHQVYYVLMYENHPDSRR